jgi:hypothetical protein
MTIGGKKFYKAGMDGYAHKDKNSKCYFYNESDDTTSVQFSILRQQ